MLRSGLFLRPQQALLQANDEMKLESVGDVKKLVEHVLTTFENFPVETLSNMWRTKSRVLKAIVACDGGNGYAIPRSNTD